MVRVEMELTEFAEQIVAPSRIEESAGLLRGRPDMLGEVVNDCLAVVDESSEGAAGGVCGFHGSFFG